MREEIKPCPFCGSDNRSIWIQNVDGRLNMKRGVYLESYPSKPKTTKADRVPKYVTRAKKAHAAATAALVNQTEIRLTPELYKLLKKHYEIMTDVLTSQKQEKKP